MDDPTTEQANAVLGVVDSVMGDSAVAVYLYGSAVVGGLMPASDLDLFAVTSRRTAPAERWDLVTRLIPISRRGQRPSSWRPVELTVVALPDVQPWGFPPRTDFQYGEWLRDRFDAGSADPEHPDNPDLALLIEQVRRTGQTLVGQPPSEVLPVIPESDLRAALVGVIPGLMSDVDSDTTNVLLTLARVLYSLETGEFTSKDAASDWAITRLDSRHVLPLQKAKDIYLGRRADDWSEDIDLARAAAASLALNTIETHVEQVPRRRDLRD
ncbi:MAG TPA: aminoglycoside adenylyltransferase family protein [Pirellulaceae bacterium]|nr:aminoglycoside adenylyltransferase family protein [Pirellulaceae bacterium]